MNKPHHGTLMLDMDVGECLHVTVDPSARPDEQSVVLTMLAKSGKRARVRLVATAGLKIKKTIGQKIPAPVDNAEFS